MHQNIQLCLSTSLPPRLEGQNGGYVLGYVHGDYIHPFRPSKWDSKTVGTFKYSTVDNRTSGIDFFFYKVAIGSQGPLTQCS
jgi:hypothetical protein